MAELCKDGFLIQSLRKSDFDCYSAYGEVIDNSTQAKAKNIKIEFDVISRGTGRNQKEIPQKPALRWPGRKRSGRSRRKTTFRCR